MCVTEYEKDHIIKHSDFVSQAIIAFVSKPKLNSCMVKFKLVFLLVKAAFSKV